MCLVLHAFHLEEVFTTQVSSIRVQSQDNNSSLFLKSQYFATLRYFLANGHFEDGLSRGTMT